jgi:hypothetical protein
MNYTADQLALQAHIRAENEQFVAEAKTNSATLIMTPMDDLDVWAAMGVYNIEQYVRSSLLGEISDMEKELYGFKLRTDYTGATNKQLQAELDNLHAYARAEQELAEQEAREKEESRIASIAEQSETFIQASNAMSNAFEQALAKGVIV